MTTDRLTASARRACTAPLVVAATTPATADGSAAGSSPAPDAGRAALRAPRDPALPQLAVAFDGAAMAAVFADALAATGRPWTVLDCRVERAKWRPQRSCTVSYRLTLRAPPGLRGPAGADVLVQPVAARFGRDGASARRAARAQSHPAVVSAAGPAFTHHPGLDLFAAWAPNDLALPALAWLADERAMRERALPALAAALGGERARVLAQRTTIVQHVPETRLCARVELTWARDGDAAPRRATLYAKADHRCCGALAHAALRALADGEAAWRGRLRTPRSLLWQADSGLHWQLALPGHALAADAAGAFDPAINAALGATLAALHDTPTPRSARFDDDDDGDIGRRAGAGPGSETLTVPALLEAQREAASQLAAVDAGWREALRRLVAALAARPPALAAASVTLHGDLHPGNVIVDNDNDNDNDGDGHVPSHGGDTATSPRKAIRLGLIDVDGVHAGPAALDLGGWAAYLLHHRLLRRGSRTEVERPSDMCGDGDGDGDSDGDGDGDSDGDAAAAWRAFVGAYRAARAAPAGDLDDATLAWATAHQLLCRRAWGGVANLKPGRHVATPGLLALAEAVVAAGGVDAVFATDPNDAPRASDGPARTTVGAARRLPIRVA